VETNVLRHVATLACCVSVVLVLPARAEVANGSGPATTAAQPEDQGLAEIVVTAQKRSEKINDVPISITAATGEQLQSLGITDTSQLTKLVPGFTYQATAYGNPIYTIRGIGFIDLALGSDPAVSVYVDQVPLPFSVSTRGSTLDLERVEVLKGPQGTLFGQDATGGAVNYIPAKPTRTLQSGIDVSYGRFNDVDISGFISGPLTDTLTARLAVRRESADGWQYSITRPNDALGKKDFTQARVLLDFDPIDSARFELNVTGWHDGGESQASQYQGFYPLSPVTPVTQYVYDALSVSPRAPNNNRAADWDPNVSFARNDNFYLISLRGDIDLPADLALTSLTAYSHFRGDEPFDSDGSAFADFRADQQRALLTSFSQELRLAGSAGAAKWMVGGNYQQEIADQFNAFTQNSSQDQLLGLLFVRDGLTIDQQPKTAAGFASLDYAITPTLTLQSSGRYTSQRRKFEGCLSDNGVGDRGVSFGSAFGLLSTILSGSPTVIPPGGCVSLDPTTFKPGLAHSELNQNNVSWRGGVEWKPNSAGLVYANVAKGYKFGSYSIVPGVLQSQYTPVTQESVIQYEIGFKQSLLDGRSEITGAMFYDKYKDKQLAGNALFPFFGSLPALINIPRSYVAGAELNIAARPVSHLTVSLGGTYLQSKVQQDPVAPYNAFTPLGAPTTYVGESFPNTPRWQVVADGEYRLDVSGTVDAFVGASATYRSASSAAFGNVPQFELPDYALLDLRAGLERADGTWRVQIYGHNVTDKYYWVGVTHVIDTLDRLAGEPANFGISLSYRWK
jgi:iron complex outermembrane recepter protein